MTTCLSLATPIARQRRRAPWTARLLAATLVATAGSAHAASGLPKTTFVESVISNIDTAIAPDRATNKDSYAPETVTYAITPYPNISLSGYATTWGGAAPGLQVGVAASRLSDRNVSAASHIVYYVQLDGLAFGASVPMRMLYSGWAEASGGASGGGAWVSLESGLQRYSDQISAWTPSGTTADSMAGSFDFDMRAGVPYRVELYGAATTVGGAATVYLDPIFRFGTGVDSAGLTLSFSEGVLASPVPEPATQMLLALGLAGLALRQHRKRQQPL